MTSSPQLIANKAAWPSRGKRSKIERLVLLLSGALNARDKVGLKMNIEETRLEALLKALPALRNPTIAQLAHPGWVAGETIIDEKGPRDHPAAQELGAEGIIEYPLNKGRLLEGDAADVEIEARNPNPKYLARVACDSYWAPGRKSWFGFRISDFSHCFLPGAVLLSTARVIDRNANIPNIPEYLNHSRWVH